MKKISLLKFSFVILIVFAASGYLMSDAFFFKRLVQSNHLTTPEQAFTYVNTTTEYAGDFESLTEPAEWLTPRSMLERKYLWCDQSAIVLTAMIQEIGFETRLVDIIGEDNVAHHTYLEVLQNGEWKTYDTVKRKAGLTREQLLAESSGSIGQVFRPRIFPNWYNRILQNTFYLQYVYLRLRKISG